MATHSGKKRAFPALAIVPLLFLFCVYPGQQWLAHLLPRLSGVADMDAGLIVLGTPIHPSVSIDLILVPLLFLFLYTTVLLVYTTRQHLPVTLNVTHRLGAIFSGTFFLLLCTAIGGLISYILLEQLPVRVRESVNAVGMNADIRLPFLGYTSNALHGNILSLLGFLVGLVILAGKIGKDPAYRRPTPLTREQRRTPYQRMLEERRRPHVHQFVSDPKPGHHILCHNQPLHSLQPEAVNYRPLG